MTGLDAADVLLVGGGLANGLIALRLAQLRPGLRVLLVERGSTLGGNHTWSFHTSDLEPADLEWIAPLITCSWPQHRVVFPRYSRLLPGGYHSISSVRFHQVLCAALQGGILLDTSVSELDPQGATLQDGRRLQARCVVDGRGWPAGAAVSLGYQKFLGLDLELDAPHGLDAPVLMDATWPQSGGYRFFYLLPWTERELLIEDTCYSDTPAAPADAGRDEVLRYARQRGWSVRDVLRQEVGVLPIPLEGRVEALLQVAPVPRSGLRAGLFHPTTSYSLPCAVRLASAVAAHHPLTSASLRECILRQARRHWRQGAYFRLLNRMLFRAARPAQRLEVFQRFYRLPFPLIERFYAGRLRWLDRLRILSGRPPVPILRALRSVIPGRPRSA
jgi:lycopene beta-cyclase